MQSLLPVATFTLVAVLYGICVSSSLVTASSRYDGSPGSGPRLQIPLYHRFSDALKDKAREHGVGWKFPSIPWKSADYYKWAVQHDLARHGRNLAESSEAVSFVYSNRTIAESDGLQYAVIDVGTPSVPHFVALDTGSDLFWLPCECKSCAPASAPALGGPYQEDFSFALNTYTPTRSNTSKSVACGNPLCAADFSQCSTLGSGTSQCNYEVTYLTANTSTSGTLYEDVIHLTEYQTPATNITATVVIGCGQTQTGQLLDGSSVVDGLLGLGRADFSVPSLMSKAGIIGDSFSICFNGDGIGRLAFGDFGSPTMQATPFLTGSNGVEGSYFVGVEAIQVGNEVLNLSVPFLFDTGTSMTFLNNETYTAVLDSFAKQVNYTRVSFDQTFDLCYATSDPNFLIPIINFTLAQDITIEIFSPVVEYYFASNNSQAGFCLAVLNSGDGMSIFGANFMLFYNLVFNREGSTLGFEATDCYQEVPSTTAASPVQSPEVAPSPGAGPSVTPSPETSAGFPPSASTPVPGGSTGPGGAPSSSASRIHGWSSSNAFLLLLLLPFLQALLPRYFFSSP